MTTTERPEQVEEQTGSRPPVLLVGNFPPVASPGAIKALEIARQLWAAGEEVETIAPRPCAARLAIPIAGPLAGYRLANQQRRTGARRVVICAERDLPIPAGTTLRSQVVQWVTVRQLVRSLAAFDHVTLVTCGHHDVPAPFWRALDSAADEVHNFPELRGAPGVTTLGPRGTRADRARLATSIVARKVFGPYTPEVRAVAARAVQLTRRLRRGGPT